jgi:hypothetical protein
MGTIDAWRQTYSFGTGVSGSGTSRNVAHVSTQFFAIDNSARALFSFSFNAFFYGQKFGIYIVIQL